MPPPCPLKACPLKTARTVDARARRATLKRGARVRAIKESISLSPPIAATDNKPLMYNIEYLYWLERPGSTGVT